eukprot:NODE_2820_length_464_cov_198.231325_g2225_i0.p1 GENE.NODE_2820_length_464_cov_198.231325_g2225_i0~~NODE_2820_length_464_cov_198.231325_g2225_i0.p1  ORF type:complete len:118 (-),score=33.54 NODE_2820_length_464_cov_198.231325_g2225_i0:51-404(-)
MDEADVDVDEQIERKKKKVQRVERKLVVKLCDMSEPLRADAIEFAQQGLDKQKLHKDVAAHVKRKLDEKHGGTWHCIAGSHFGSNVTHDAKTMINFYLDKVAFLIFRNGPPEKTEGS